MRTRSDRPLRHGAGRGRPGAVRLAALVNGLAMGLACGLLACGAEPTQPAGTREAGTAAPTAPPDEASGPASTATTRRGLWVLCEGSQRVLERREALEALLDDARALGATDLFVQVYRGGRAWFASTLADAAPYAATWRETAADGTPQDAFDVLIERAHAEGLRVHAWVNVLSLAGNREAPVATTLPHAVAVDQYGRSVLDYPELDVPPPQQGFYRMGTPAVWLDPGAPRVAEHLAATFEELVRLHPDLDGLHLDYIRYPDVLPFSPGTRFGVGLSFGHGEATRERFRQETGLTAPFDGRLGNGDRFDDWRRDRVTDLVRAIRERARATNPRLLLSAAVWAYPERAYLSIFQDWRGWLQEGLLEFAVPMLYTRDERLFGYGVDHFAGLPNADRIWVGLGAWLFAGSPDEARAQLARVAQHPPLGSALFSWDSIHDAPSLLAGLSGDADATVSAEVAP